MPEYVPHFSDLGRDEVDEWIGKYESYLASKQLGLKNVCSNIGLPVSFDKDWDAFIPPHFGFVQEQDRIYLPDDLRLMKRIRPLAKNLWLGNGARLPGGRFFISHAGVKYRTPQNDIKALCTWD